MHHNLYKALYNNLTKGMVLTCLSLLICSAVNAQSHHHNQGLTYGGGSNGGGGGGDGWGIALMGGYDVPTGDLGTTFKAAPTFGISVLHNLNDFTFNASINFVAYKPKLDTFYVNGVDNTEGYFKYGNYSSLEIYAGVAYNVPITDGAKLYFGLNVGSYYNFFSLESGGSGFGTDSEDTDSKSAYVAPKLGINFLLSDNIWLGVEGRYNLLFTSASGTGDAFDSGYATTTDKTFTGSLNLIFNF